ncbi:MAG: TolC family protein [Deltaproteobacteria bacterium]|nr:TolC family protein [Deltaproteobacteria bacterium]
MMNRSLLKNALGIIFVFCWLLAGDFVYAIVDYEMIVVRVIDHNPSLKAKGEEVNIAQQDHRYAMGLMFPEISVNTQTSRYNYISDQQSQLGPDGKVNQLNSISNNSQWQSSAYLLVQYKLSSLYKELFNVGYYKNKFAAKLYEYKAESKEMLSEMTDVYSAFLETEIRLKYGTEILKKNEEAYNLKKVAVEYGESSQEDLLQISLNIKSLRKDLLQTRKELKLNQDKLNEYMATEIMKDDETLAPLTLNETDLPRKIAYSDGWLETEPSYASGLLEVRAAEDKKTMSDNHWFPEISLYGRYDCYGSDYGDVGISTQKMQPTSTSVGMTISLPLFMGGRGISERDRNIAELKRVQNALDALKQRLFRSVRGLWVDYLAATSVYEESKQIALEYEQLMHITNQAKYLGGKNKLEVLDAEIKYLDSKKQAEIAEINVAMLAKKLLLETDFEGFMVQHYGNRADKY